MLALLEKVIGSPKAGSLCCCGLCAECMQSPGGIRAKKVMRKQRGAIAVTGSSNASVAKPCSPSLHTLSGDLCVDTRVSKRWTETFCSHSLCLFFHPCVPPRLERVGQASVYSFKSHPETESAAPLQLSDVGGRGISE